MNGKDGLIEYPADEIFKDIPGDDENISMVIPDEIMEKMGWGEGDSIVVKVENGGLTIVKAEE
jgi:AbrB family looped-hinge helix DNA binding protein